MSVPLLGEVVIALNTKSVSQKSYNCDLDATKIDFNLIFDRPPPPESVRSLGTKDNNCSHIHTNYNEYIWNQKSWLAKPDKTAKPQIP
jgi:hypothetical protein